MQLKSSQSVWLHLPSPIILVISFTSADGADVPIVKLKNDLIL